MVSSQSHLKRGDAIAQGTKWDCPALNYLQKVFHLMLKKYIAFKSIWQRVQLPGPLPCVINLEPFAVLIPADAPFCAHNFQLMSRWSLDIIQM
jgi:hypothetical protein